jgi:hypothetical protein
MIAQGTEGLSRGSFLEGVLAGRDMLAFVDVLLPAIRQHPGVIEFVQSWVEPVIGRGRMLKEEEWFVKGHGIIEGRKDAHRIWIPMHAKNRRAYIWSPPPIIADVALEECMKAVHKRMGAFHVFLIPRLYSSLWSRMFHKLSDLVFQLSPGLRHWPDTMHKPLFIGISLLLLTRSPCTLQRTPLLVGMERKLHQVLSLGEADGQDILRQLL